MHTVTTSRDLDVPAARAWEIIDDFGGVYRYHPLVEQSPVTNGVDSGLGAERVCHFTNGDRLREVIVDYDEGSAYTVEITDPGSFPLERARGRISVESLDPDRSRVTFEMQFQPKYGLLGWLMAKAMMRRQFAKILGEVIEGIGTHARTGRVVGAQASRLSAGSAEGSGAY